MQLVSNFTTAATAATILRILNFSKLNSFDLANGVCGDFTPVQSYQVGAGFPNQEWLLTGGPLTWQIVSANCNTFLAYPGAGPNSSPQIIVRAQTVTRKTATTSWQVSLVNPAVPTGPWTIIETASGAALTAWDHDGISVLPSSPITLEEANPSDTRQQFWFAGMHRSLPSGIFQADDYLTPLLLAFS
ncbi:hypothetical protein C8R44DRAFT_732827 [Mycena epipterygia]|nr:hypothetical protein C8R44DRAFT_732827 [Mycena epipterygia]